MKNFEQLGSFYVGRRYDLEQRSVLDEAILYDAKDLTTHAVCVGMTGSGKTGLAISILEEAAIDGIPVIAIDPKGDIGNILLTFPELRGEDFLPWIDEGEALRKGRTTQEHAQWTADLWRKGLAEWGQGPDRIRRFAEAADRRIYTPGSRAGYPVAVLRSLVAPADPTDDEAFQERIAGAVSGLLSLLGIEADPLRSREHILLANILDHAWRASKDVDLPGLIQLIQKPPFERIGVFDVESFYSQNDRFGLAMMLNNLLASPGFAIWTEGPPLDVPSLLHAPDGKPRISVLTLGHLSDSERMFFVTTLLNEIVTWTRSQSGSQSLRAILYMDEVFGYLPPTANPPSKRPLLTLLKQARAFGLGVVLATQNPVDLDYKALSNIGTWFLGRLQTERDKLRVLDGLEGAAAGGGRFERAAMDRLLSSLDSRVFLMNNVHDDEPTLLHTRWALSYLGGPLTREQISRLTPSEPVATTSPAATRLTAATVAAGPAATTSGTTAATAASSESPGASAAVTPPSLPPEVPQHFVPVRGVAGANERLIFRPHLAAHVTLHHADARANVDEWTELTLAAPLGAKNAANVWSEAQELATPVGDWTAEPEDEGEFADLPSSARNPKRYRAWEAALKSEVYRSRALTLFHCSSLKLYSQPGEEEGAFQARLRDRIREERDLELEKLRARYAPKLERLQDRLRAAELRIEQEDSQAKEKKMAAAVSVGTTLLGALFGRKLASTGNVRRASSSMRAAGRIAREKDDMERAKVKFADLQQKLQELEEEFETKLDELREKIQLDNFEIKETSVAPRKADIAVSDLTLLWIPWRVDADGIATPAS